MDQLGRALFMPLLLSCPGPPLGNKGRGFALKRPGRPPMALTVIAIPGYRSDLTSPGDEFGFA